ncbi:MAG: LAGLIDADG family homing endonuclease [Nanoarchaeota archaeon]|nr:LAGLIDADG family homing endonuclease [Nanoarchaeota archaeon]
MDESQKFELENLVEELEGYRGRHTELITVMIPAGATLTQTTKQLENEKGTATNIKSTGARKNVINALERAIRKLKEIERTPPNGLAVFSGNVSGELGKENLEVWAIEPPKKLKVKIYRCDQTFVLEPLKEMLETEEVYGLLIIERNEASIGILDGKHIKILQHMTSGIPGKTRAGGQCLSPDTLLMKENGELVKIKNIKKSEKVFSQNFKNETICVSGVNAKWNNKKELFKLTTCYPKLNISASKDHLFFVRTEKGIEEKTLEEIKIGDYLIMPEEIKLSLKEQKINFSPKIKQKFNMKEITIPKKLDSKLAKILGYYLGDGSGEIDRISFSEQREEVANYYRALIETYFDLDSKIKFRKKKGYWQIRFYSRILSQFIRSFFNEKDKTLNQEIPAIIQSSPNNVLASFIAGFFDAEGYVSKPRVALGINNKTLAKELQFCLLRLGVVSSIIEYDNRRNPYSKNIRYTIAIDDLESLNKFAQKIGFCSIDKQTKLEKMLKQRSNRNKVRQLVVNGREVAKIIRNHNLTTTQFNSPDFFCNKKQMSKEVFKKRILDKIKDLELRKHLSLFYNSNLIVVKVSEIKSLGLSETVDIETKNHNFIANGLIVHNSAQRFARIRESAAKEFFKRVAEAMKKHFWDNKKLKGILVGGPIPTKEEFLEQGQLVTALKEKVIAVKDLGGTEMHGLQELVQLCGDVLAEQEITKQKEILDQFFEKLAKNPNKVAYGEAEVEDRLTRGAVDKLILSKSLSKDKIKILENLAKASSTEIHFVTKETSQGVQFDNLGGVGGLLRFEIYD